MVVEDALEMCVFRRRRGWKREAPEDWGWCGWWSQWSLPALTTQPYGPALGRAHVMEGAWQTLDLKPITWRGRQTNCLRCRLCPEILFLQSHSPCQSCPQAAWGSMFAVWTWIFLYEPHYHIHLVSLFLHADDQKLCLWKALAAASWKLTMLRQIEALVLMLTVNDGSLKSPPTALPPSQLTFSCRRPYLKLLICRYVEPGRGNQCGIHWGSWLWEVVQNMVPPVLVRVWQRDSGVRTGQHIFFRGRWSSSLMCHLMRPAGIQIHKGLGYR